MQHTPRQAKLLGATVRGVGTITAVSCTLFDLYALITDGEGLEHHCFVSQLEPLLLP